ncbi:major capsid protein [Persephonella sp.]
MGMQINLSKFLTVQKIKDYIQSSPYRPKVVTKELYTRDVDTYESAVYPYAEIQEVTGNVPLVLRGGQPVNVAGDSAKYNFIEVQPVDISETLNPVDLVNMKALGDVAIEKIIRQKVQKFHKIVLDTVEALSAQTLSGKISYQIKTQNGLDLYEVNFGTVADLSPSSAPTNLKEIYNLFVDMEGKLQENGYGQEIVIYSGKQAYGKLLDIGLSYTGKTIRVEERDGGLYLGKYFIKPISSGYKDKNGNFVRAVPDNKIKMVDRSAPFRLRYLSIDDLRANLKAMPLFVAQKPEGKAIELEGQSKPLPIPVTDAIVDATIA